MAGHCNNGQLNSGCWSTLAVMIVESRQEEIYRAFARFSFHPPTRVWYWEVI
jgi:hypothetical protein